MKVYKVYITKYCISSGIEEAEVEETAHNPDIVRRIDRIYPELYYKPFWHESIDDAVKHANEVKRKRIEALKRQIKKLQQKEFTAEKRKG